MISHATVHEKTLDEIKKKLETQISEFSQIAYIEAVLSRQEITFDIRKWAYTKLSELNEKKNYFEKAARILLNRATIEVTFRDRIATFLKAGELFAKAARMEESVQTFMKAYAESNSREKEAIKQKMANVIKQCANDAEKSGKKRSVIPYYQKLLELSIPESERKQIRDKLIATYKALGNFSEAKSLEMGLKGQQVKEQPTESLDKRTRAQTDNELGIEIF